MYSFLFYVFFSLFCVQKIHFFFTGCKIDMYLIFSLNESLAQVGTGGVFVRIFFFHPQKAFYKPEQCPNAWQWAWPNLFLFQATPTFQLNESLERGSGMGLFGFERAVASFSPLRASLQRTQWYKLFLCTFFLFSSKSNAGEVWQILAGALIGINPNAEQPEPIDIGVWWPDDP